MKITAIILTYNNPFALHLILKSIEAQKIKPYEVIIADDGSGTETANLISEHKNNVSFRLKHIWQEDKGFRASRIRNKAIRESSGDTLLFSDGDLVFHPSFFSDIENQLKNEMALIGSRVFLKKQFCEKLKNNSSFNFHLSFCSNTIEKNRLNAIRFPFLTRFFTETNFSLNLRGGLLAIEKQKIIDINGWNEDFTGWGLEDTELVARLHNSGIRFKKLKFAGITYHLWHPMVKHRSVEKNKKILDATIDKVLTRCNNGLFKNEQI